MLDFIKDIFAAFRQNSLERMKSPFLGAFVFSWLGFNWQLLAILFISKKDVEERVAYINQHFGIESLLIGPLFTTTLICILLPQATKHIIKMQSKPISAATLTTMTEKIALAAKQLEIADIESKKRLSDKREERNIEEGIEAIKLENSRLKATIEEQSDNLKNLTSTLDKTSSQLNESSAQMSTMIAQSDSLQKIIKDKDEMITQLKESNVRQEGALMLREDDFNNYTNILGTLRKRIPAIFEESTISDGRLRLNETALKSFENVSKSILKRTS